MIPYFAFSFQGSFLMIRKCSGTGWHLLQFHSQVPHRFNLFKMVYDWQKREKLLKTPLLGVWFVRVVAVVALYY